MLIYIDSLPLNQQTNYTDCLHDLVWKLPVLIGVFVDLVSLSSVGKLKAIVDPAGCRGCSTGMVAYAVSTKVCFPGGIYHLESYLKHTKEASLGLSMI